MSDNAGHFLDAEYWNGRYLENNIPWNTGVVTPALIHYLKPFPRDVSILIPGVGTSREGLALAKMGFTNLTFNDYSKKALTLLKEEMASHGFVQNFAYVEGNFFEVTGTYDIILEQTFFCALDPAWRSKIVDKVFQLLTPGGTWFGVLFAIEFDAPGPPFGGTEKEYKELFSRKLNIENISMCKESIPPRQGRELFFICKKIVNG